MRRALRGILLELCRSCRASIVTIITIPWMARWACAR